MQYWQVSVLNQSREPHFKNATATKQEFTTTKHGIALCDSQIVSDTFYSGAQRGFHFFTLEIVGCRACTHQVPQKTRQRTCKHTRYQVTRVEFVFTAIQQAVQSCLFILFADGVRGCMCDLAGRHRDESVLRVPCGHGDLRDWHLRVHHHSRPNDCPRHRPPSTATGR